MQFLEKALSFILILSLLSLLILLNNLESPPKILFPSYVDYPRNMSSSILPPTNFSLPPPSYLSTPLIRSLRPQNFQTTPLQGYESQLDYTLFPVVPRKPCEKQSIFSIHDNIATLKCQNSGAALIHLNDGTAELFGNSSYVPKLTKTSPNSTIEFDSGFLYVKCSDGVSDVVLKFKENRTIYETVLKQSQMLQKKSSTSKFTPLTVVIFVIDSTSRNSLYRNLPKTLKFLNKSLAHPSNLSKTFKIFDFLLNNAIMPNTVPNLSSLLYGLPLDSLNTHLKNLSTDSPQNASVYLNLQKTHSLWSHFASKGFVTLFNKDEVSEYLSRITGRKIDSHHQLSSFWKAALDLYKYNDFDNSDQCIGSNPPYRHTLRYLQDFLTSYKSLNKFAYVHIATAHETSGTRLQVADEDFVEFFDKVLKFYTDSGEDFVFSFMSDHGSSKTDFVTIEGFAERLSSFHLWICSRAVLERFGGGVMEENTHRLVSRYDLYFTYKVLSGYPYGLGVKDVNDSDMEVPGKFIIAEEISETRNCEEIGILQTHCLLRGFVNVSIENWEAKTRIKTLVKMAMMALNEEAKEVMVSEMKLKALRGIYKFQLDLEKNEFPTHYFITFQVEGADDLLLLHGTVGLQIHLKNMFRPPKFVYQEYMKVPEENLYFYFRLWGVSRLSFEMNRKKVFFHKNFKFSNVFEPAKNGESCRERCRKVGRECSGVKFEWILAEELGKKFKVRRVGNYGSIEVKGDEALVGRGDPCELKFVDSVGVCQCSIQVFY